MSNNLVSQPLSISPSKMGQMEQITNKLETPIPAMKMGLMGFVPDNPASQQLSASKLSMEFVGSMPKEFELQKISMLEANYRQADGREKHMFLQQHALPPKHPQEMVSVLNNQGTQQPAALTKRKVPMEPTNGLSPRSSSLPNKRPIQMMEHRPWLQEAPTANRKAVSSQSVQQVPGSKQLPPQNKMTQIESSSPRSVPQKSAISKSLNAQSSRKVGAESSGSVRTKMRESLAAALALVSQEASKPPSSGNKDEAPVKQGQNTGDQPDISSVALQDGGKSIHEEPKETLPAIEGLHDQTGSSDGSAVVSIPNEQQGFQSDIVLSTDDVPFSDHFFVKDELLQGNGLTWVLESDMGMVGRLSDQTIAGNDLVHGEVSRESKEAVKSPEDLADQVEAELFKLFGGVNKKYKEKGRSLLFNLKDRNNPELRERVVSGEISPERLCSMTAEELASKELSEWRIAKAEEFAQMVVLPDSSVDVRRLVKKTHKGEFQVVELEHDDGISEEVSLGASSIVQNRPKANRNSSSMPKSNMAKKASVGKGNSSLADKDGQCTFTIPPEDQVSEVDMMVEDALGNLPPIVSLDEFMESLDSEPPFVDLQVQDGKTESPEKDLQDGSEKNSPKKSLKVAGDDILEKPDRSEEKDTSVKSEAEVKFGDALGKTKCKNSPVVSKGEQVWQGSLQLNISSTASVVGIFKSGEKTTVKDWTSSVEIKGRVRLDAFEKFLQDLRMSRSRAIMVVHFLCHDGAPESERAGISEVGESYVTDERVGFAEPCKGVELYFCPPHTRTQEMLSKILPEDQIQRALDSVDSGLIGVVIWRRTSQFADNNNSHKHTPKKQHYSSSAASSKSRPSHNHDKPHRDNMNVMTSSSRVRPQQQLPNLDDNNVVDDDDDVPPGFGPQGSHDVDDLPEFNFSGGRSGGGPGIRAPAGPLPGLPSLPPTRPVEKIRELILKYGQTGNLHDRRGGVPLQPWNDDDDDIPEWQPQIPTPRADLGDNNNPLYSSVARPPVQQHVASPVHGVPPPGWGAPVVSPVPYRGAQGRQPWQQDQPRSRGF